MRKIIKTIFKNLFILVFLIGCEFSPTFVHAIGEATLADLVSQTQDGGTLVIDKNYSLDKPIEITKDITIQSEMGNIIVASKSRHFIVNGASLTLDGIIIDGNTTGGGILVQEKNNTLGSLIIKHNTTLRQNYSSGHGGAIEGLGAYIHLESGAVVSENKAGYTPSSVYSGSGGGIFLDGDNSTLIVEKDVTLTKNVATNKGGAISINRGKVDISGIINNNTAYRSGGGVYIFEDTHPIDVSDATLSNNIAYGFAASIDTPYYKAIQSGGGGMVVVLGANYNQEIHITNTTFSYNKSDTIPNPDIFFGKTYTPSQLFQGGGLAIFSSSNNTPTTWIEASTFIGNHAGSGGGIFTNTNTVIENTTIQGNTTFDYTTKDEALLNRADLGGGIFFDAAHNKVDNTNELTIKGGSITDNFSLRDAGIHLENGCLDSIHIDGALFENNKIGMNGVAWEIDDSSFTVKDEKTNKLYTEIYSENIKNITGVTQPYTNLYNNVDISFVLVTKVTFDANGGIYDASAVDFFNTLLSSQNDGSRKLDEADVTGKLSFNVYLDQGSKLNTNLVPIRDGYTFLGWLSPSSGMLEDGFEIIDPITFTAQWKLNETLNNDNEEPTKENQVPTLEDKDKSPNNDPKTTPDNTTEVKKTPPISGNTNTPPSSGNQNIPPSSEVDNTPKVKIDTPHQNSETPKSTDAFTQKPVSSLPQSGTTNTALFVEGSAIALGIIMFLINIHTLKKATKNN
ncbi:hypothetical protein AOC36_00870 [Erysipelothrix larvae]|uniref:Right handed beta helix domain-containing protein n=1 Tax=Erysipelothrix larvae TaxID=1514105 RepID=A0A109UGF8_9FIRM|nr:hypothetical protein [Erysipelothrix larvae]AMC92595.1 hypothetical protein AOC36_00870 [Erysipelothrix larvae]